MDVCDHSLDWLVGTAVTKLRRPELARLAHAIGSLSGGLLGNQWVLMLYSQALGVPTARVTEIQFFSTILLVTPRVTHGDSYVHLHRTFDMWADAMTKVSDKTLFRGRFLKVFFNLSPEQVKEDDRTNGD